MTDSDHYVYRPTAPPAVDPGPPPSDHFVYRAAAPDAGPAASPEPVSAPVATQPEHVEWPAAFAPAPAPARGSSAVPTPPLRPWLPKALLALLTAAAALAALLTAHTHETSVAAAEQVGGTITGPAKLAKGMQLVTYKNLQIQVPSSWVRNASCAGHPTLKTVVYLPRGKKTSCAVEFEAGTSEVIFDPPPFTHEPISGVRMGDVTVAGQHGVRTDAVVQRTRETYATLFFDRTGVNVVVIASDSALAKRILDSARVAP